MPTLWKYLLKSYFQFLSLCVSAFIAILLVIRFQEIALFASSGATLKYVALFSLYQIPYILPIAVPVSCLIASMLLFQRMSGALELTALRACGVGIRAICYPLLLAAFLISVVNFTIVSEVTPVARTKAKGLVYSIVNENPLIIMQKDSILNWKTAEFDLKNLKMGKKAEEVICIMRQASSERIGLFTAKEISVDKDTVNGKSISVLSSAPANGLGYDHLIIENQKTMQASKEEAASRLLKADWFAKEDLLKFRDIIKKWKREKGGFRSKTLLEIIRRVCLGFCPFTFTFIGIAFGTSISRQKKKSTLFYALALASLIMICFVASKTVHKSALLALLLYSIPQPLALFASFKTLSRSSRGVE
jgi:lipopolysaccharide export system permease protein